MKYFLKFLSKDISHVGVCELTWMNWMVMADLPTPPPPTTTTLDVCACLLDISKVSSNQVQGSRLEHATFGAAGSCFRRFTDGLRRGDTRGSATDALCRHTPI